METFTNTWSIILNLQSDKWKPVQRAAGGTCRWCSFPACTPPRTPSPWSRCPPCSCPAWSQPGFWYISWLEKYWFQNQISSTWLLSIVLNFILIVSWFKSVVWNAFWPNRSIMPVFKCNQPVCPFHVLLAFCRHKHSFQNTISCNSNKNTTAPN